MNSFVHAVSGFAAGAAFAAVLMLCACDGTRTTQVTGAKGDWWKEAYDRHTYVVRGGGLHGCGSGIAHDPDCPCGGPKKEQKGD